MEQATEKKATSLRMKTAKKLNVLVTGGAGFLGKVIIAKLLNEGCAVTAIVKKSTDISALAGKDVKFIFGDIREKDVLALAVQHVDVVVHAAATMWGPWEDFKAINVDSTRNLLELTKAQSLKRFVHISSVSVYDHTKLDERKIFPEDTPFQTSEHTFYSQSKMEAEAVVWEYIQKQKSPCVILRPGALYGHGGPLYPAQLGLPLGEIRHGLIGGGLGKLPLCHVKSVADAIWLAINNDKAVGNAYNVTEDESISRLDFLRQVKAVIYPNYSIVRIPYWFIRSLSFMFGILFKFLGKKAPLRPLYLKTCSSELKYPNDKIKKELGWQPGVDFKESITELLTKYRDQQIPQRNKSIVDGKVAIPSSEVLKVAVVGCGGIAFTHLDILKRIPNAAIVGLVDPSKEARENLAKKFGVANTYENLAALFAKQKVDVVHILSPVQFHADLAIAAIKKNCHVLVEKPMALNAADAEKIVAAAKQHKVKLTIGHNHLFDAPVLAAREIIAKGRLGRLTYVESWYGAALSSDTSNRALAYEARNAWFYNTPGSLYQDYISHPISLLTDIMGEVQASKSAVKYYRVVPHMSSDELRVLVENEKMLGAINVSLAASPRYQFLKVYGTKATMTVDILNKYVFVDASPGFIPKTIARNLSSVKYGLKLMSTGIGNLFRFVFGKLSLFDGTERLVRLFYCSILLDESVPVSPEEGLRSMRLMDEIWRQLPSATGTNGATRLARKKEVAKKQNGVME